MQLSQELPQLISPQTASLVKWHSNTHTHTLRGKKNKQWKIETRSDCRAAWITAQTKQPGFCLGEGEGFLLFASGMAAGLTSLWQPHSGQESERDDISQLLAQYTDTALLAQISGQHLTIQQQLIHKSVRQWQRRQLGARVWKPRSQTCSALSDSWH